VYICKPCRQRGGEEIIDEDARAIELWVKRERNGMLRDSESKTGSSRAETKRSDSTEVGDACGSSSSSLMARQASSRVAVGPNGDGDTSLVSCSTGEVAGLLRRLLFVGKLLACLPRKLTLGPDSDGEAGLGKLRVLTPGMMIARGEPK
jgi:hypothetical protein